MVDSVTESKYCTKCGLVKLLSEFYHNKKSKDGHRHHCKECIDIQNQEYEKCHKEEVRACKSKRRRAYYATHGDEERAYQHAYAITHRDEIRAYRKTHRERESKRICDFHKAHPEQTAARNARWRARKFGAFGADYTTVKMIAARCETWGNLCWLCGKAMRAIDHVKPLIRGGAHLPCNLRPICPSCNSKKGITWPYVVATRRPNL